MKMSSSALQWAASGPMAAFLCHFCGSLEASVAVYQLSASCWLTLRDRASTALGRKDKVWPSARYLLHKLGETEQFFFSLLGPLTLPPSSTPDRQAKYLPPQISFPLIFASAVICLYGPDMLQDKRSKQAGDLQQGLSVSRHL